MLDSLVGNLNASRINGLQIALDDIYTKLGELTEDMETI